MIAYKGRAHDCSERCLKWLVVITPRDNLFTSWSNENSVFLYDQHFSSDATGYSHIEQSSLLARGRRGEGNPLQALPLPRC